MRQACELIASYQEKYDCPAILVGDMNAGYDSPAVQLALTEGGFVHAHDVAAETTENIGYNGCGGRGPGTWSDKPFVCGIDHILLKGIPGSGVIRGKLRLTGMFCGRVQQGVEYIPAGFVFHNSSPFSSFFKVSRARFRRELTAVSEIHRIFAISRSVYP